MECMNENEKQQKDELLQIRISKQERKQLMKEAQLRGVTLSSLVRGFLVSGKLVNYEKN